MQALLGVRFFSQSQIFLSFVILSDLPDPAMETSSHTHSLTNLIDRLNLGSHGHDCIAVIVSGFSIMASEAISDAGTVVSIVMQAVVGLSTMVFLLTGAYLRVRESRLVDAKAKRISELKANIEELEEDQKDG